MDSSESLQQTAEYLLVVGTLGARRQEAGRRHVIALADRHGIDVARIAYLTDKTVAEVTMILAVTEV